MPPTIRRAWELCQRSVYQTWIELGGCTLAFQACGACGEQMAQGPWARKVTRADKLERFTEEVVMKQPAVSSIAIIGASVRGTSMLERLLASAPELHPTPLVIHTIDPHAAGSGRIWRAGQPNTLIMNTVAGQSTVFTDDSATFEGPIHPGPSLAEWCRRIITDESFARAGVPAEVRDEAARTVSHSSPSRLLYGYYLRWCHDTISRSAPPHVEIEQHRAKALRMHRATSGWTIDLDDGSSLHAAAVVLAVGWLERDDIASHPRRIAPGNPIDQDLTSIRPGQTVAIRGLGMGFFDTFSQLTEQRGGRFEERADGAFRYEPSGQEPVLIAGSRRGIPFRAKPDFGAPPFFPEQRILRGAIPRLRARRPLDFAAEVLPLIERDAAYDYYRALHLMRASAVHDITGLLSSLTGSDADPTSLVARHVPNLSDRFCLADAVAPLRHHRAPTDADIATEVRADIAEAALGINSPLKLALHSYAAARSAVTPLVEFGGLTEASFPAYRTYLATAAAFASGPPLRRARQLMAAHEAGIITFAGRAMTVTFAEDGVTVAADGRLPAHADYLIDAWLPAPSVNNTGDPLLQSLVAQGHARRFQSMAASDALDIRPADGAVISAEGIPAADLFSVGIPHEDIRVSTLIAPVPGTDSSVLRETDAAARSALRAAHEVSARRGPTGKTSRSLRGVSS
ncbi:FAD/NAD(P)-binding protein (plasmid) [Coraliomargarita sp. W4R53]